MPTAKEIFQKPSSPHQRQNSFHRDGFVVLRNFMSMEDVHRLREHGARYLSDVLPGIGANNPYSGSAKHLDLHDPFFASFMRREDHLAVMAGLLDDDLELGLTAWNDKPANSTPTGVHQDSVGAGGRDGVTLWVALDAADRENGCLHYAKGSHKLGVLGPSELTHFKTGCDEDYAAEVQPGDAVLHHSCTVHWTDANRRGGPRRAYTCFHWGASSQGQAKCKGGKQFEDYIVKLAAHMGTDLQGARIIVERAIAGDAEAVDIVTKHKKSLFSGVKLFDPAAPLQKTTAFFSTILEGVQGLCGISAKVSRPAISAAGLYTGRPLRILCLHGGNMTAVGFQEMLADLKQHCGAVVEFVYTQAPHKVKKHNMFGSSEAYLWMGKDEESSEAMWVPTLEYLKDEIEHQGPFDGLLGYSMGACVAASLLAAVPEETFQFVVLSSGYLPSTTPSIMTSLASRKPLMTPSLHIQGEKDFIPRAMMDEVMECFDERSREWCLHPGGHDLPRNEQHIEQVVAFLMRFTAPQSPRAQSLK